MKWRLKPSEIESLIGKQIKTDRGYFFGHQAKLEYQAFQTDPISPIIYGASILF
jgi:hypothetical protein